MTTIGMLALSAPLAAAGMLALGSLRWRSAVARRVRRLEATSAPATGPLHPPSLDELPEPVARYLRAAIGTEERPLRVARVTQVGEFLLRPDHNGWRPFHAREVFTLQPVGFVWDARIRLLPGLSARVLDALIDGAGSMYAAIAGLVPVVHMQGSPELTAGALHRYLAEAVWFPPALLPQSGVDWAGLDDRTARATLTLGRTTVWLDFRFGADGLVERVYTPARFRELEGAFVPTPWEGRHREYELRGGLRIPTRGEVAWLTPQGRVAYWRGRITEVEYVRTP